MVIRLRLSMIMSAPPLPPFHQPQLTPFWFPYLLQTMGFPFRFSLSSFLELQAFPLQPSDGCIYFLVALFCEPFFFRPNRLVRVVTGCFFFRG